MTRNTLNGGVSCRRGEATSLTESSEESSSRPCWPGERARDTRRDRESRRGQGEKMREGKRTHTGPFCETPAKVLPEVPRNLEAGGGSSGLCGCRQASAQLAEVLFAHLQEEDMRTATLGRL